MFSVTEPNHRSAQILLLLVIPGQLIFLFSSHLMKGAKTMPSFLLTAAFLAASVIQVSWPLKLCSPKNIWHHSAQSHLPLSTRTTAIYFFFWEFANFKQKFYFVFIFYLELLCEGFLLVTLSLVFLCTLLSPSSCANHACLTGLLPTLFSWLDGPLFLAAEKRPRQLFNTISHSPWRSTGDCSPLSCFSHPVVAWWPWQSMN